MLVKTDGARLRAFLESCADAEALGGGEYTVDFYDVSSPVSMDILIDKKGVNVLGALELIYDEEQDGWYVGEKIKDADRLAALLDEALGQRPQG